MESTDNNREDLKPSEEEYLDEEFEEEYHEEPMVKVITDREFAEVENGEYLENGFYVTPNGSFWDGDGVYFNRQGLDRHEGYYDEEYEYHPGRGWIPHLLCYEDEIVDKDKDIYKNEIEDGGEEVLDYDNCDDLHEEVDYDKLTENKDKSECVIKHKILCFANREKKDKETVEEKK
jgi:hypothetical protein